MMVDLGGIEPYTFIGSGFPTERNETYGHSILG